MVPVAGHPHRDLMRALIGELNELLKRSSSSDHGSTSGHLVAAVRDGTEDSIATWPAEQANRWEEIRPYVTSASDASAAHSPCPNSTS